MYRRWLHAFWVRLAHNLNNRQNTVTIKIGLVLQILLFSLFGSIITHTHSHTHQILYGKIMLFVLLREHHQHLIGRCPAVCLPNCLWTGASHQCLVRAQWTNYSLSEHWIIQPTTKKITSSLWMSWPCSIRPKGVGRRKKNAHSVPVLHHWVC